MKLSPFNPFLSVLLLYANPICVAFRAGTSCTSPSFLQPAKAQSSSYRDPSLLPSAAFEQNAKALPRQSWSLASSTGDENENPFSSFFKGVFSPVAVEEESKPQIPDLVVDSDYTLAIAFAAVGASIILSNPNVGGIVGGGLIAILASLFAVQATRVRFAFDKDCFELKNIDTAGSEEQLSDSGENVFVGGKNRWAYGSFVNWDFYPSIAFPILVYFKETQTSPDGQIHFFPAIANCKQLEEQFELRGCARVVKD